MPTDPYVPPRLEDRPRQHPNLAPGVSMPAAEPWEADRPAELRDGQPSGPLLGSPGPNVGYALTLAERASDRLHLAPGEERADAIAVLGEIAMRRAAAFGRAPVPADVEFAMTLLGYAGDTGADLFEWRPLVVRGAHEDYVARRAVVDAVPADLVRVRPEDLPARLADFRAALRAAFRRPDVQT